MRYAIWISLVFLLNPCIGQVDLIADGPGDTYDLITSVLAPGSNPIEVPDCGHEDFGDHIDEVFDNDLGKHVFRFHIHTDHDDDRCIIFDRQRNEIKSFANSPDNLLAVEGEIVQYSWKFKLPAGFQSSSSFTHIHQIKPVGGEYELPTYTLTTRKSSPDRLELRYASLDNQVTLKHTPIEPFIDTWVEVVQTITYGTEGTYDLEIKRVADGDVLFDYTSESITNWRPGNEFVRPKWGIYRSLNNSQDLRDEMVLFADFRIEELENLTTSREEPIAPAIDLTYNVLADHINVSKASTEPIEVHLYNIQGQIVRTHGLIHIGTTSIDVSDLGQGIYVIQFNSAEGQLSDLIFKQ